MVPHAIQMVGISIDPTPSRPARSRLAIALTLALALFVLLLLGDLVLLGAAGSSAPAWSHWWCSAAALRSSPHHGGGVTAAVLGWVRAISVHWPHILPLLLGVLTMLYLRRANARYLAAGART